MLSKKTTFGINGEIGAGLDEVLQDNTEVALLPPVSGG